FSPDGTRLFQCSLNRDTGRLWDTDSGALLFDKLPCGDALINEETFSPDGRLLVVPSRSAGDYALLDVESGKVARRIETSGTPRPAAFLDGQLMPSSDDAVVFGGGSLILPVDEKSPEYARHSFFLGVQAFAELVLHRWDPATGKSLGPKQHLKEEI